MSKQDSENQIMSLNSNILMSQKKINCLHFREFIPVLVEICVAQSLVFCSVACILFFFYWLWYFFELRLLMPAPKHLKRNYNVYYVMLTSFSVDQIHTKKLFYCVIYTSDILKLFGILIVTNIRIYCIYGVIENSIHYHALLNYNVYPQYQSNHTNKWRTRYAITKVYIHLRISCIKFKRNFELLHYHTQ